MTGTGDPDPAAYPLRHIVVFTVEIMGVVTTLMTMASFAINSIYFASIGLSFPQIATPSDLIMSGAALFTRGLILMTCASLAFAVGAFAKTRFPERLSRIAVAAFWVGLACLILPFATKFFFPFRATLWLYNHGFPIFAASPFGNYFIFTSFLLISAISGFLEFHARRRLVFGYRAAFIGLAVLVYTVWETVNIDPASRYQLVVANSPLKCADGLHVAWMGTSSVAAFCEGQTDRPSVVILERQGLVLEADPEAYEIGNR